MNHGSLFSGIGGFDLAAEWMGWNNEFHCEWNEFGQKILKYYWPKAKSYADITKTDFTIHRGKIDILTGGFPCQPYSVAGKQRGKEDERHLWPEMLRAIREIQPTWIVGENVLGILNWNGGLVFDEVQSEMEAEGYEVQTYVLPAASVNAPHKRDRVWFIAYRNGSRFQKKGTEQQTTGTKQYGKLDSDVTNTSFERCNNGSNNRQKRQVYNNEYRDAKENKSERNGRKCRISEVGEVGDATNSCCKRLQVREQFGNNKEENSARKTSTHGTTSKFYTSQNWENFPTQAPICDGDDGLSSRLDAITFPKWRTESVKGGGNAIVPQVAYQLFKTIEKMNTYERQGQF